MNPTPQFLWPEVPRLISRAMLAELDRDPPGTWIAQPKIDGRRRIASNIGGVWTWRAKNKGDALPVPADLRAAFESMPWPDGITLDMEYSGLRQKDGTPELHVFDLLTGILRADAGPVWLGGSGFGARYQALTEIMNALDDHPRIHLVPLCLNGLVQAFDAVRDSELVEGIVVRRATSTMRGDPRACVEAKTDYYKAKHR